jgi:drug/metabolite transporter (DMT)-like permease
MFAIIAGIVVFGEFPDRWAAAGMVLIVAAGLYAAHREWIISRAAVGPSPT